MSDALKLGYISVPELILPSCINYDNLKEAFKTQIRLKFIVPTGLVPSPPPLFGTYMRLLFSGIFIQINHIFVLKTLIMLSSSPKLEGDRQIPKIYFFKGFPGGMPRDPYSHTKNQPQTGFTNNTRGMHVQESFIFDF